MSRKRLLSSVAAILVVAVGLSWMGRGPVGEHVDRAVAEAELAMERALFGDAIAGIDDALALGATSGRLHLLRGDAHFRKLALTNDSMDPAAMRSILVDFDRAIEEGEIPAAAYLARAYILRYLGDDVASAAAYEAGAALPHRTGADHFYRASVERMNRNYASALGHYREAVRRQPAALVPYLQLALFEAQRSDDMEVGLDVLDACARVHPDHPEMKAVRAWLWLCDAREQEGEQQLRELVDLSPPSLRAVSYLHRWLVADERVGELPELYDQLHRSDPGSMSWRVNRVGVRIQAGDLAEAELLLGQLEESERSDPIVRTMRLVLDVNAGNMARAIDALQELSQVPGHPHILKSVRALTSSLRDDSDHDPFFVALDAIDD